jgi:hypothetical protein
MSGRQWPVGFILAMLHCSSSSSSSSSVQDTPPGSLDELALALLHNAPHKQRKTSALPHDTPRRHNRCQADQKHPKRCAHLPFSSLPTHKYTRNNPAHMQMACGSSRDVWKAAV